MIVWSVMTYGALWLDPTMRVRVVGITPAWWFYYHIVWGTDCIWIRR